MNHRYKPVRFLTEIFPIKYQRATALVRENILPQGVVVRVGRQVFIDADKLNAWCEAGGAALPGGWRREAPGA